MSTDLGYSARPPGSGPWPGVVLLHEFSGVDEPIRGLADRFAAAGYLTLAPNLFRRGIAAGFAAAIRSVLTGRGAAVDDVAAARDWLLAQPDHSGRMGIAGNSLGASLALRSLNLGFNAAAVNYPVQLFKLDDVLNPACPTMVSLGGTDPTAIGAADRFERALSARGIAHDVHRYPGAGHSYFNGTLARVGPLRAVLRAVRQGPDEGAASDTWRRTQDFFARHLA